MADGSDDPRQIDDLARLVERGVVVAAASRYSPGGQQVGGPLLKGLISRSAGRPSAGSPGSAPSDATNSFKAYSTDFIREVGIDSRSGFEIGLELTAKARRLRRPVAELPTIWLDRTVGESNFDLKAWIPQVPALVPLRLRPAAHARAAEASERRRSPTSTATPPTERMKRHDVTSDQKVLVSGSAGFIGGYVVEELLGRGYAVVGIDNYSKYGPVEKSYDSHPDYHFVEDDARNVDVMTEAARRLRPLHRGRRPDRRHLLLPRLRLRPARHQRADHGLAVRRRHRGAPARQAEEGHLPSSSMVFESTEHWPSKEGDERKIPPPLSSYGFQKLAVEYFAKAAWDQYQLPYTIVRPFNCVGIGEGRALGDVEIDSGNVKLAMSHVVPDLVQKIVKGQDPLHILGEGNQVRHYTYGGDLARGIVECMEQDAAHNDDFNISTPESTTVRELAEVIWRKIKGPDVPLRTRQRPGLRVRRAEARARRRPRPRRCSASSAPPRSTTMLDEVIPWVTQAVADGRL